MVNKPGFSLIELTVVIGLLTLLLLAISGTMLMSMASSNRIRTSILTKQSGNRALEQLQIMIRNARSLDCQTTPDSFIIHAEDGGSTTITLETARLASNSAYLTEDNLHATDFSFECEPLTEPKLIKLSFNLRNAKSEANLNNPQIHFETSVSLRN